MTVKDQIIALRSEAGEEYVRAATDYLTAWVKLHSIDLAVSGREVGMSYELPGFATPPVLSIHAEFMPSAHEIYTHAHERAFDAHKRLAAELTAAEAAKH